MKDKKKVVVIGSNSFSGSDFIDLLLNESDYQITGVSRSPEKSGLFLPYKKSFNQGASLYGRFRFYQMDLNRDMHALRDLLSWKEPEYIVNFASQSEVAPSWDNPGHWFQTNAVAVANLVGFLKDQNWLERYVHISSPEVYGTCQGVVKENHPMNPSTPYAASRAAGDLCLSTFHKNYNFPLVTVRSTNVYGVHQQLFKIIPRSVIRITRKLPIELHGGGKAVKSYIHIRDVSRGEKAIMEKGRPGQIYHLSPAKGVSIEKVVQYICARMAVDFKKVTKTVEERLGQDKAYVIDSSLARSEFAWSPKISLGEGLAGVIGWIRNNMDEIMEQPLEYEHRQ